MSCSLTKSSSSSKPRRKIGNQDENDPRFPYHKDAPYRPKDPATPEQLLAAMDAGGVTGAVIVHPEPYQDDHRYLEYCLAKGHYTTEITTEIREAFMRGLRSDSMTANAEIGWYNLDGENLNYAHGFYHDFHPALWAYGEGSVTSRGAGSGATWRPSSGAASRGAPALASGAR